MAGSKLTPDVVDKLLDRLGSDDSFRTQFAKNPKGSLLSLGAPADVDCGACMTPAELAPKAIILQTRAHLRDLLLGQSSQKVFTLEAGSVPN